MQLKIETGMTDMQILVKSKIIPNLNETCCLTDDPISFHSSIRIASFMPTSQRVEVITKIQEQFPLLSLECLANLYNKLYRTILLEIYGVIGIKWKKAN